MARNPYESYKKQSIMTMTPGDMLITLYDEILKNARLAKLLSQRRITRKSTGLFKKFSAF